MPWSTVECEIDLRPGGRSIDEKRLVWTNALLPGFRPAQTPDVVPFVTAEFTLQPDGRGTRYTAHVMHRDEADCRRHVELGFHEGWRTVMEQAADFAARLEVDDA